MKLKERKNSVILQVAILFLIGILIIGALTYFSELRISDSSVKQQIESRAAEIADEVKASVMEYPSYKWLLNYWYSHAGTMDIEYDAAFSEHTATAEKCRLFTERHPGLEPRYVNAAQCNALPAEDQALYAEIVYSWLISRIDELKQIYHVSFLFCVVTEEPYDRQFFLFSAAEPGAVRGTNYEEVYPLGHTVTVSASQQEAMRGAVRNSSHLADAGAYVDYYAWLGSVEGHSVLVGLTYDLSSLRSDIRTQAGSETTLAIIYQLALSLVCLGLIFLFVLRPLKKVQKAIREYTVTKNSSAVSEAMKDLSTHNEIGELSADVVALSKELDSHVKHIRSITAEKERIGVELSLAARIQTGMLPHTFPPFPDHPEVDVFATMHPAKEVGGDFYDYFLIDDDHMGLVIADVSGKGVPAALFMMASKIILQSVAMLGHCPAEILSLTNTAICSNNQADMFITVWLGILELSTGKLTAANAGHEYPVLKKPGGRFEVFRDRHGFIIGGMDNMEYTQYELVLEPGEKLFVYTDGIPEATNAGQVAFGVERMVAALNEEPDAGPEQLILNVRRAVDCFVDKAEQFDDLTMLCVEYRGKTAPEG